MTDITNPKAAFGRSTGIPGIAVEMAESCCPRKLSLFGTQNKNEEGFSFCRWL